MPYVPPKVLRFLMSNTAVAAVWSGDDVWAGYPYRWTTTLAVALQTHSSPDTPTPYLYDGNDVAIGDYIVTSGQGRVLKIVGIQEQSASVVACTVEDENRANTIADPTSGGDGGIPDGEGLLFSTKNGWPILHPLPDSLIGMLPPYFSADIIARFLNNRSTTVAAADVAFDYPVYAYSTIDTAVKALLDNVSPAVDVLPTVALTLTPARALLGSTVTSVTANWTVSAGSITAQTLTDAGSLAANVRTYTFSNLAVTQNKTYTLAYTLAYGLANTATATTNATVEFVGARYWGALAQDNPTDAAILSLASDLETTRLQTRVISPAGKYIYFAWPAALGQAAAFRFNGLPNSAWTRTTRDIVNSAGATIAYHIYRSDYAQHGENIAIEVL